jgi:DNA-binding helix-turn-helix protein
MIVNRLSKNIKSLRKLMGETQEELAYSIDLDSKSAVANWESGANKPSPENLKKIAAHYRVTVEQLLEGDFSTDFSLLKFLNKISEDETDDLLVSMISLFPIIVFKDEEELYPRLVDARELHKQFLERLVNEDDSFYDYLLKTMEVYEEIIKNSNCISAKANSFGLFFFLILLVKMNIELEGIDDAFEIKNKNRRNKEIKRFISEVLLSRSINCSDTLNSIMFENYYEYLLEEIKVLKGYKRLFELGDYYYCLFYLFELVDNELGTAVNTQIGLALLSDLSIMKNRFVKRIEKFYRIVGKVQ